MPTQPNLIVKPLGPIVNAINRLKQSLYSPPQTVISSIKEGLWPDPLQPVQPMGPPLAEPLGWQMDWGRNLIFTTRADAEYGADTLRRLSKYPLARICIENNKDMLTRMPWKIQLKAQPGEKAKERASREKGDKNIPMLSKFWERPNPSQDWSDFWRSILDDLLVIDAPSVFVGRDSKNKIAQLRWVEGDSVTVLVDEHGWRPEPPNPAYQQLWEGYPRLDLTAAQLVYRPRNIVPRNTQASYLYGYSPTEQLADEIKTGMARLQFVLNFYTEGTIPGAILFAPLGTPPEKVKEAQQFLDSELAGQLAKRRRLQILQGFQESGKTEQLHEPKEPALADLFDEVHMRKIAFGYGVAPNRLAKTVNRASGEQMQEAAEEEGTLPFMHWLKGTVDYMIQCPFLFNLPDYEVAFDPFHELDRLKQAMADKVDVECGMYTINEKREERGDDPLDNPVADQPNVYTAQGAIPLGQVLKQGPNASGSAPAKSTTQQRTGATTTQNTATGKATYTNGLTKWAGCKAHRDSYPRVYCSDCIYEEKARMGLELASHIEI